MADLIDREVARTTICEKCENYSTVLQECKLSDGGGWCKVFSLYDVPTVDAEPVRRGRWIPVEDALPENRCGVIFTVDRGHPFVCVGYRINTEREGLKLQRWFDKLSGLNFSDYDVKAWMPMPDAYEPEKEDDK